MQRIAIFGGTFDPVHLGHIKASLTIQARFKFDVYNFMPCKIPLLKSPSSASSEQRVHMLELALDAFNMFSIDKREILRETPSYMVDSLESYQKDFPNSVLTLIMGYDAFVQFDQWHEWRKVPLLCNLIVINREHQNTKELSQSLQQFITKHQVDSDLEFRKHHQGALLFFNAGIYDISSTQIRAALKHQNSLSETLIPKAVLDYINQQGLYR